MNQLSEKQIERVAHRVFEAEYANTTERWDKQGPVTQAAFIRIARALSPALALPEVQPNIEIADDGVVEVDTETFAVACPDWLAHAAAVRELTGEP